MKTKFLISCLSLISVFVLAQNNAKSLEGYYNLSKHEAPTHLYLFEDNTFYYYSIFGAVDLEIFGKYTISNNELHFYPKEEQTQPYALYGRQNTALKDSIAFNYMQSRQKHKNQLVFGINKQWYKRPIAQINKDEIYYKIKENNSTSLVLGYPTQFYYAGNFFQVSKIAKAEIPKKVNDFLLTYNHYAYLREHFSKTPLQIKENKIVNGEKLVEKEPIKNDEKEKIKSVIKKRQLFLPSVESRGNTFTRITTVNQNKECKLKWNSKNQLVELLTYSQDGKEDENGLFYYNNKKLEKLITKQSLYNKGENKLYYENGKIRLIKNLKYGIEQGKWKGFYPNGKLAETGVYKDGFKNGEWKTYYKNGTLKEIENYKEGQLKGEYKQYSKNGKLLKKINYPRSKLTRH